MPHPAPPTPRARRCGQHLPIVCRHLLLNRAGCWLKERKQRRGKKKKKLLYIIYIVIEHKGATFSLKARPSPLTSFICSPVKVTVQTPPNRFKKSIKDSILKSLRKKICCYFAAKCVIYKCFGVKHFGTFGCEPPYQLYWKLQHKSNQLWFDPRSSTRQTQRKMGTGNEQHLQQEMARFSLRLVVL